MADNKEKKNTEVQLGESKIAAKVLLSPWVTEASTRDLEMNKYVFKVAKDADKGQIKKAIEELYKVKVISVNTVNIPRRFRNYGRTPGWIAGFKKAVVKLKQGDNIEVIKAVYTQEN